MHLGYHHIRHYHYLNFHWDHLGMHLFHQKIHHHQYQELVHQLPYLRDLILFRNHQDLIEEYHHSTHLLFPLLFFLLDLMDRLRQKEVMSFLPVVLDLLPYNSILHFLASIYPLHYPSKDLS